MTKGKTTSSSAPKAANAWGMIYSFDNSVPRSYLADDDNFYVVRHGDEVRVEKKTAQRHRFTDQKLVRISKTLNADDVTIKPMLTGRGDDEIDVDGQVMVKKLDVKGGKCQITIKSLDVNLMFEAFCDESKDEFLSDLDPDYRIISKLGEGSYGSVYRAFFIPTEHVCAVKAEHRTSRSKLRNEFELLKPLHSEYVIRCYDLKIGREHQYLSLEIAEGGSVAYRIKHGPHFDEDSARHVFKQLFRGIRYLHQHNVAHRDIKPANLVLTSENKFCGAKLIDFGLSCRADDDYLMSRTVGSLKYMSPELLYNYTNRHHKRIRYSTTIDVWGLGTCLFLALVDVMPYRYVDNHKLYLRSLLRRKMNPSAVLYEELSPQAQDFIHQCLEPDGRVRMSSEQICEHAWLNRNPRNTISTTTSNYYSNSSSRSS